MGYDALNANTTDRAINDFEFAAKINPFLIRPHWALFKIYISKSDSRFTTAFSNIITAIVKDTQNQFLFFFNLYHLLIGALFFTLMAYSFILFFKHFRHTYHRITEGFHRGMPKQLKNIFACLIVAVPIIILLRFDDWVMLGVWLSLLGIAATWIYMDKKEKKLVVTYIIFLLATPYLLTQFASVLAFPWDYTSPISTIIQAQTSPWDPELAEKIDTFLAKDPRNEDLLFSRAIITKRGGYFDEAKDYYLKLIDRNGRNAYYYNNLGNIYFIQHDYQKAIEAFENSIKYAPLLAEPHYNLSTLYLESDGFDIRKSQDEREIANSRNRDLIHEFTVKASNHYNREIIDVTLPHKYLWTLALNNFSNGNRHLISGVWTKGVRGNYNLRGTIASAFIVLIISFLVARQKGYGDDVLSCTICEKSICKKCRKGLKDEVLCPECHQALGGIKRLGMQEHLKGKLRRKADKKKRNLARLYSIIPGGGFIFRDFLTRGFIFMFLGFIYLLIWITNGITLYRMPHLKYVSGSGLYPNIAFGIVALIYWLSLMQASARITKEEPEIGVPEEAPLELPPEEEY